jgi:ABC-2 type transport system ATP-binding protein
VSIVHNNQKSVLMRFIRVLRVPKLASNMLELTAVHKSFGAYPVLSIDKLIIPAGICWIKGANGAGKSTLLNILAGFIPFKGEIRLNQSISLLKQPVAYRLVVNHSAAEPLYPSFLTGNELIDFAIRVKKGNKAQVESIRNILGIDHYLGNPTGSYSSGMLKKLSLLLAFIGQPSLILLDEPFTTLDHASQKALVTLIDQYLGKGISFLLTSHQDIEPADIRFTKIYLVENKQIHEHG